MEGERCGGVGNGKVQLNGKMVQSFQRSFVQVQKILDQNRLLINEINQNHESKTPHNLTRNVGLIRELNNTSLGLFISMLISPPLSQIPFMLLILLNLTSILLLTRGIGLLDFHHPDDLIISS
ncbi:protein ELF4-LIKE 3 [Sesamum angolense]|uniref:Protein ELF4-LIKE 3 n=1 Tax=Sesamum angolense TaxID=2727404 RepID=A0AAE1WEK6_9LAMI|nr:protein ELF4-LIKE 3 [Sesamum angolense]